jgi:hypothetical protein
VDPYLDLASGVLRNLLGITDAGELAREQFIGKAAEFLADVNAQRAFFSQLAHDAGHYIDWVRMDPGRNNAASAAARHGDLGPMTAMLADLIDPPYPSRQ